MRRRQRRYRKLARRVLEIKGFMVVKAKDSVEVLERLPRQVIDLAFMDINILHIDGYAFTARIRAMPRFTRLLIGAVTANVMRGGLA